MPAQEHSQRNDGCGNGNVVLYKHHFTSRNASPP